MREALSVWRIVVIPYRQSGIAHAFRTVAALTVLLTIMLALVPGRQGASAQTVDPTIQQLADTYAPIAMLRHQTRACDKSGEGYFPSPVDWIFHNPDVTLRADAGGDVSDDPILTSSITPQELAAAGPGTYLDFPHDPHHPGCLYEQYFRNAVSTYGLQPTTYAHIVIDEGKRKLYLQYWFWYLFNDWNNLHESDWEMIQLVFDATTPEDALTYGPDEVGFAQHEGGQLIPWSDTDLERQETHLLVYPGAGSHATYATSQLFISWGEHGSGFGCDNTTGPSTATPLQVIVIPEPVDPDGPFAWALFQGRWGQRGEPLFDGPLGPNLTLKWTDPEAEMADWTTATLSVPNGPSLGLEPTRTFCAWTEYGSRAVAEVIARPALAALLGVAALLLIVLGLYRVRPYLLEAHGHLWQRAGHLSRDRPDRHSDRISLQSPGASRRQGRSVRSGPGLARSLRWSCLYGRQRRRGIAASRHVADRGAGGRAGDEADSARASAPPSGAAIARRSGISRPMLLAWLIYFVLIASASLTVLALPFAIYFGVTLQFFPQAVILEHERPGWSALYRSWRTTRGQIPRTLARTLPFLILAVLPGPVAGITFLTLGGSRVQFASIASGFLYALMIPYSYVGITMAWRRLRNEPIIEPLMASHTIIRTDDVNLPKEPA